MSLYSKLSHGKIINLMCFQIILQALTEERVVSILLSDSAELRKLRERLISGLIYHNSTLKFRKVKKDLTVVKVFRFCGFLFPMKMNRSLYSEVPLKPSYPILYSIDESSDFCFYDDDKYPTICESPSLYEVKQGVIELNVIIELNLMFVDSLTMIINDAAFGDRAGSEGCNMIDAIYILADFCGSVAYYLNDQLKERQLEVTFHPKPVESLLEKLVYRQDDVHDMVQCTVHSLEMMDAVQAFLFQQNLVIYPTESKTKSGVIKAVFTGRVRVDMIGIAQLPLFVEVQCYDKKSFTKEEKKAMKEYHFYDELARIQLGSRFDLALRFESRPAYEEIALGQQIIRDIKPSVMNCIGEIEAYLEIDSQAEVDD
jgi:hypothetical protein